MPNHYLSKREKEIIQLLIEGNSLKKISKLLFINIGTFYQHLMSIRKKQEQIIL